MDREEHSRFLIIYQLAETSRDQRERGMSYPMNHLAANKFMSA